MSADVGNQQLPPEVIGQIHNLIKAFAPDDVSEEMDVEQARTPQELLTVLLKAGVARIADDVRERRQQEDSYEEAHAKVTAMAVEDQQQFRDQVWTEFIANLLAALQQGNPEAFTELKEMIRHPYTLEGLLLEFRLDDGEPTDEFIRDVLLLFGMTLFPRMYTDAELEEHQDRLQQKFL